MQIAAYEHELQAAHAGDPTALADLLARSRQDIRRYAEYHCSVNDVEDAVQEALILVSRKLSDLRSLECFASWVFRIVKRECNRMKRIGRRLAGEPITDDILPGATPDAAEWRQDLASALQSLPYHYREIVLLRDLEGLSIAELGNRLGVTTMAVKARLHRARALAREYLRA
ncbi:RNA polymerase sigma factor [Luteimonas vadosa]|uniref:Sigma-70 family RNA polymerase sigma factor n=1 Tax=Luteimonas vadosa TaxID=1165507 RepID=A0ABP9E2A5_9GAMM